MGHARVEVKLYFSEGQELRATLTAVADHSNSKHCPLV